MPALVLCAVFVVGLTYPANAASIGDGSGTDNPALSSAAPQTKCAYWWQCQKSDPVTTSGVYHEPAYQAPPPQSTMPPPQPSTMPARHIDCAAVPPGAETPYGCPVDLEIDAPQPVPEPIKSHSQDAPAPLAYDYGAPAETQRLFAFEPEWNVGLRGGFENSNSGSRFVISVLPSFSLRRTSARNGMTISGTSEIVLEQGGGVRIAGGALNVDANHALGRNTNLTGSAALTASQESAFAAGAAPGIRSQPLVIEGSGRGAISHQMGRFGVAARANAAREVYGETHMTSGAIVDNSYRSRFAFGGGLRASYDVTRTTSVFVDGSIERNVYDAISPSAGVKLDSWTFGLRGGLALNFGRGVRGEFAGGYGIRRFDAAGLADASGWLASAEISVRPQERLSFTGTLSTEFGVPDSGTSTSEINYLAGLAAQYRVNSQWGLRASLGAEWRDEIGGTDEWSVEAGAGADFALNKQTALTADYSFTTSQTGAAPIEQSHQISLGVRYGRTSLSVSNP